MREAVLLTVGASILGLIAASGMAWLWTVVRWVGGTPQEDDVTIVVVRRA